MPPRPKLTETDILEAAFDHVRRNGWEGLTARFLAETLNTSTKPIYFHFPSMKTVEEMVVKKALDLLYQYKGFESTGDVWIDQALRVVMFAVEEKNLWRAMNDENHVPFRRKYGVLIWKRLAGELVDYPPFQGISRSKLEMIRRARWIFTHGYATLLNNMEWSLDQLPDVVQTLTRVSRGILRELKEDPEVVIGKPLPKKH